MTSLDVALRPVAQRLINQFGKTVTYSRFVEDVGYDPTTGVQEESSNDVQIKAIVTSYSAFEMKQGSVEQGDLKLMVYDMDPPPTTNDSFTVDGNTYAVINVAPEYSGEQRAAFLIQARRA